jgi:nucleotide-binding universal stress UspA family protein
MALKKILVAVSGGSASDGAVETACRLAKRVGAHLEGFHIKVDPAEIVMMAADGFNMPIAGEWIDRLVADTDDLAKKTAADFAAAVARHDLSMTMTPRSPASASWHVETGYAPILIAQRARFFDLAVLGRSERVVEKPHSDAIEQTLIGSGRPVFLAPAKPPASIGESVALGWNGSAEAVRALAAALPLLTTARAVIIISIGGASGLDVAGVLEYLGWQGVSARHRQVATVAGAGAGQQLLSTAREENADLLVMGGYGRGPWREMFFGGATRELVAASLLPLLLVH